VFTVNAMIYGILVALILKFFRTVQGRPSPDLPPGFVEAS
jgi:hypothetical protein